MKEQKRSARDAAKKSADKTANLDDATLAQLDEDAQASRAERRAKCCPIDLPDRKTKIVETKIMETKIVQTAEKKLQAAEAAAAVAESEAEREEKRAGKLHRTDVEWLRYLSGMGEGWKDGLLPDEVHAARNSELEAWAVASKRAREARMAAFKARAAADEALAVPEDAHEAVAAQRNAKSESNAQPVKSAREISLEAKVFSLEAEVSRLQLEVEQLRTREVERDARDAEIVRLREERRIEFNRESREIERDICRAQWAECRTEVVQQHAEKVWGSDWQMEYNAPKVYSLVGKSAEEVRALAGDVSQVTTATEERVKLNRLQWEMLEK